MSDVINKLVEALAKLFTFLTWGRLLLLVNFLLVIALSVGLWENRPTIYTAISVGRFTDAQIPVTLSPGTRKLIDDTVDRSEVLIAIEVVQTDFRNNTKRGVHFHSDIAELEKAYQYYQVNKVSDAPLWITGDGENNDRIIGIVEQEMVCIDVPRDIIRRIPMASKYVNTICSLSVPPRFGKMVGYVNLWLTQKPTSIPEYKQLLRGLSDEIYNREVLGQKE